MKPPFKMSSNKSFKSQNSAGKKRNSVSGCYVSNLDYSHPTTKFKDIKETKIVINSPLNSLPCFIDNLILNYYSDASRFELVDLANSYQLLTLKVVHINYDTGEERDLTSEEDVAFVPLLGFTLFKKTSIFLNDAKVDPSATLYDDLVAYILTLMNFTKSEIQTFYNSSLPFLPEPGRGSANKYGDASGSYNDRCDFLRENASGFDIKCPIFHPLAYETDRYIPNNVQMKFEFLFNSSRKMLIYDTPSESKTRYAIKLMNAKLVLIKKELNPPILSTIEHYFSSGKTVFPVRSIDVCEHDIETGSLSSDKMILVGQVLPELAYVGITLRDSLENPKTNPYLFNSYNLKSICFRDDSNNVFPCSSPVEFEWAGEDAHGRESTVLGFARTLEEYFSCENTDPHFKPGDGDFFVLPISLRKDSAYVNGDDWPESTRRGNLSLQLTFNSRTTLPLRIFILLQYNKLILMNKQKNFSVVFDE